MSLRDAFELPSDAHAQHTGGRGSLVSRLQWHYPDGSTATWESRNARKRGFIEVLRDGIVQPDHGPAGRAVRLRRCNDFSGMSFFLGGALFTLGALLAHTAPRGLSTHRLDVPDRRLLVLHRRLCGLGPGAQLAPADRRRWRAGRPPLALVGLRAAPAGLARRVRPVLWHPGVRDQPGRRVLVRPDPGQVDRLVWAPELAGCILFLVSGHIGIMEVCHGRFRLMTSSLGWWIVIVNQIGSWLFMLSGLAAFVRPVTGEVISVELINWGTAVGAACFSAAGLAQLFERPATGSPTHDRGEVRAPRDTPRRPAQR